MTDVLASESLQAFTLFVFEQGTHRVVGFCDNLPDGASDSRLPRPGVQSRLPASRAAFLHVPVVSRITALAVAGHAVAGHEDGACDEEMVKGIIWASDRLTAGVFYIHTSAEKYHVIPMRLMAQPRMSLGRPDEEQEQKRQADLALLAKMTGELPLLMPGHLYPIHAGVLQDLDFGFGTFKHIPGVLCYWSLLVGTAPAGKNDWVYAGDPRSPVPGIQVS